MSTLSLNPAELTNMVTEFVKDRAISPNRIDSPSLQRKGSPKKPALSLGAMAAELEEQEKQVLRKRQQEEALKLQAE